MYVCFSVNNIGYAIFEDRPDDIPESLWILLNTIKEDIKGEIKALDSKVSALIRLNGELKENVTSLEQRVELLEDRLIRTDTLNKRLQSRILDLETRSMRNNIIFSFDPKSSDFGTEAEGENCVSIIKHFRLGSVELEQADKLSRRSLFLMNCTWFYDTQID